MQKYLSKLIVLFISFAFLVSSCTTSPPVIPAGGIQGNFEYVKSYLTWFIEKKMQQHKTVGVSVALLDEDEILWARGFGMANQATNRPADENTVYKMGSISKVFTATAIMQLAEKGLVNLDNPVTDYIPEFTYKTRFKNAKPITVRDLMTHHSGLQGDYLQGMMSTEYIPGYFRTTIDIYKDLYASYPPEYVSAYCNMGVDLSGIIIERVSGVDFIEYMKKNIFTPLEMNTASFLPMYARDGITDLAALPYRDKKEGTKVYLRNLPAGALNCSTLEMTHFMQMVLAMGNYKGRRILSMDSMQEMFTTQNSHIALDGGFPQGLNWMLYRGGLEYAGPLAWHNGGTAYFRSSMAVLREYGLGAVVVTNTVEGAVFIEELLNVILVKALEAKTGLTPPPPAQEKLSTVTLGPEEAKSYEGLYAINQFGLLNVKCRNNKLTTQYKGRTLHLIPLEKHCFAVEATMLGFIKIPGFEDLILRVTEIEGKKIVQVRMNENIFFPYGEAVYTQELSPLWQQRTGKFILNRQLVEKDHNLLGIVNLTIKRQDGFLVIPELGMAVKPINDSEALILGLGRGAHDTVLVKTIDGKDTIFYSGYEWIKK